MDRNEVAIESGERARLRRRLRRSGAYRARKLAVLALALLCDGAMTHAATADCKPAAAVGPAAATPLNAGADWAMLQFYKGDNARLPPPRPSVARVVFIGDSITAAWQLAAAAPPGTQLVNRGIGGQTALQIRLRFAQDVLALQPAAVHIMAGINDLAEDGDPTSLKAIEHELASMVELARVREIRVILAAVTPAEDFPWRRGLEPAAKIRALNGWLRDYARRCGVEYVDYYAVLSDAGGGFRSELSDDGVHPNRAGYALMSPLARGALERTLRQARNKAPPR
jgi:lysophospholipase L1-like esterase